MPLLRRLCNLVVPTTSYLSIYNFAKVLTPLGIR